MKGIKMSDCKFYVNEEEKTVVCVIPDTTFMLNDFINENFRFSDFDLGEALWLGYKSYRMPRSFMGKAVCAAEDEWDEELGRMIAFSRAKDKCYRSFFKRANALVNTMDRRLNDMMNMLNDMGDKLYEKREKLEHMIEDKTQK